MPVYSFYLFSLFDTVWHHPYLPNLSERLGVNHPIVNKFLIGNMNKQFARNHISYIYIYKLKRNKTNSTPNSYWKDTIYLSFSMSMFLQLWWTDTDTDCSYHLIYILLSCFQTIYAVPISVICWDFRSKRHVHSLIYRSNVGATTLVMTCDCLFSKELNVTLRHQFYT